jgi:hypothetical protein
MTFTAGRTVASASANVDPVLIRQQSDGIPARSDRRGKPFGKTGSGEVTTGPAYWTEESG